jgi:pseudaminic acid synthase
MKINGKNIGHGAPCYVIAEMSANHGRDFERAIAIVRKAKESGANAIKLQTFTADSMTLKSSKPWFQIGEHKAWGGRTLHDIYSEGATPLEWHKPIKEEADRLGLDCFSTPFDASAVDFLEKLNMPAYKIASFELVDDPLLKAVARTGKPVIMSTGMATLEEIEHALDVLRQNKSGEIALLKCISSYPAELAQMNIRTIPDLIKRFNVAVGLSDHSLGTIAATTAVAAGASIIEKHFCLDRETKTLDSFFSLTPDEMRSMVASIRQTEEVLGKPSYGPDEEEKKSLKYRRSIFTCRPIKKGDIFTVENIRVIRPGQGLSPQYFEKILGTKAKMDIDEAEPLTAQMIDQYLLEKH